MSLTSKLKTAFRGDVSLSDIPLELVRRRRTASMQRSERGRLDEIASAPAELVSNFASLTADELVLHFKSRGRMVFAEGKLLGSNSADSSSLIEAASKIVNDDSWELAGFGLLQFDRENAWRCDPLTGEDWRQDYHADVVVYREGGPDIRVLWELNRFGHALILARAFAMTGDEAFAEKLIAQIEDWMAQNPYGLGANWNCAMEVALRAINLLAAFDLVCDSEALTAERLARLLQLFDQHGKFICDNNEFSYVSTSNHYLSDVVGLFWIGTLLPELNHAAEWKRAGFSEMLRESDKQILADGANFEASTGYHKFVTEMLLYSYIVGTRNRVEFPDKFRDKLRAMLTYLQNMVRPDGRMTLIGDADGSQIVPIVKRDADDADYLLAVGALALNQPDLFVSNNAFPETLWFYGESTVDKRAAEKTKLKSKAFPDAGSYVMREGDLYLHFNANDCGLNGRGSHGHNDALSIELSAFGQPFIVDPGSYAYNLDREMRHNFRSTSYHSSLMIDGLEQNTTDRDLPFVMGNEANPLVIKWHTSDENDTVAAEHSGYMRLGHRVVHRRSVEFDKLQRYWIIEDGLEGEGKHGVCLMFHIAPGIELANHDPGVITLAAGQGSQLYIASTGLNARPVQIPAFVSRNYGERRDSFILLWRHMAEIPFSAKFFLVPSGAGDDDAARLEFAKRLTWAHAN